MAMYTKAELGRRDEEMMNDPARRGVFIGREKVTTQKTARKIMDHNFFGIEEAVKHFGARPTESERRSVIKWTEEELRQVKDTHVLVAMFPLSILEIRGKIPLKKRLFDDQSSFNKESFSKERGEVRWQLVRKTPVPNSPTKTWEEQQALLLKDEETPTARVMTYAIIGHFLANGDRLFEDIFVRCSDVDSEGFRAYVGYFFASGLSLGTYWDDRRYESLGLSVARKSSWDFE